VQIFDNLSSATPLPPPPTYQTIQYRCSVHVNSVRRVLRFREIYFLEIFPFR
jgi:hypothetical protein